MDFKLLVFTGICLLVGFCQGAETGVINNKTSSTNLPPEPTTVPTTTTTDKTTTTTEKTTTTTPKSTTTSTTTPSTTTSSTTTPSTTTSSTTTPSTTTSSTTAAPNTTTTPAPPAPTTPAPPQSETWVVVDSKTNQTCIIAQMALQFNVTYPVENKSNPNITSANTTITVPLDNSTVAEGLCTNTSQIIILKWKQNSVEMDFKLGEDKHFFVSLITLNLTATELPNFSGNATVLTYKDNATLFTTPLDMSYKCDKVQDVNMTAIGVESSALMLLSHAQLQAYREKTDKVFGAAHDCESFDTPDIVPIAVGCALALLVLIVLAAYLIGRRRSQNRGYLSIDNQ